MKKKRRRAIGFHILTPSNERRVHERVRNKKNPLPCGPLLYYYPSETETPDSSIFSFSTIANSPLSLCSAGPPSSACPASWSWLQWSSCLPCPRHLWNSVIDAAWRCTWCPTGPWHSHAWTAASGPLPHGPFPAGPLGTYRKKGLSIYIINKKTYLNRNIIFS